MNSRYWGKILIKLLKFINSVYNFNKNGSITEKVHQKLTEEAKDGGRWSRGKTAVRGKGLKACLQVGM